MIASLARRLRPYMPYPHFMGVAPLDTVLRLLWHARGRIPPAYWPRLAALLLLSALNTVASLPERLLLAAWLRLRPPPLERSRAPVFVVGYFRSGTTFLQNLLAADPNLYSPTWPEVLAPQTFVLGWTILRHVFAPLLPMTRLDTVVPMGAKSPAEDDFALNALGGMSILAGRAVLPQSQVFFNRFHDLEALSPNEFARWRSGQMYVVQKLSLVSGGRRLLLKSPSHTARIRHLLKLFPGAKFVHISRPPETVLRSNLLLARELQRAFALQHPLSNDKQAEMIADEYLATELHYLEDRSLIPPGDSAEVRLSDLVADPLRELTRIYRELELPFPHDTQAMLEVAARFGGQPGNRHAELTDAQKVLARRLEPLAHVFGSVPSPERVAREAHQSPVNAALEG